ncbi:MAG: M23 family metallopeptidase [Defluviitaleaceae bacterium]|nr:M23 family metallopeptidase [Defluviitaleaceae bacterium]
MKNTSSETGDSIFRKKGFFIALYSCLGAVAILAMVITLANFGQPSFQAEDYEQDAAHVGADQVEPYLSQVDEEAWFRPRQTPTPLPEPTPEATPPRRTPAPIPLMPTQEPIIPEIDETPAPPAAAEPPPAPYQVQIERFRAFEEGDELLWPVEGKIVMDFSMDSLIYDPTLDQFRTNDNIRIAAAEGTLVQSSARGYVLEIGRNVVRGNYVKIDHGNGLVGIYGQLGDNKLVSVGEVVSAGQLIGSVGKPSLFGVMHGPHVNLRFTMEDEPVNPHDLLVARED